jgi:glycine/serine hydroxymethyltransferase
MILSMDEDLGKRFNSAVFPGLQGGPLGRQRLPARGARELLG